jgi:hypothetical protein
MMHEEDEQQIERIGELYGELDSENKKLACILFILLRDESLQNLFGSLPGGWIEFGSQLLYALDTRIKIVLPQMPCDG